MTSAATDRHRHLEVLQWSRERGAAGVRVASVRTPLGAGTWHLGVSWLQRLFYGVLMFFNINIPPLSVCSHSYQRV